MRYFKPRFKIATLVGEQKKLLSKIGGVPWGLPEGRWPHCCGVPQKLLAQLCHEPPMLDLGGEGTVLHLFQCLECFGVDECGREAFIMDRSQLENAPVRISGHDHADEGGRCLIGELWIEGWDAADDGIPHSRLSEFYMEKDVWALHDEFPDIDWYAGREATKFGGPPRWTGNGPMGFPAPPFEFLFQLNNSLYFDGLPPTSNEAGCETSEYIHAEGRSPDFAYTRPDPELRRVNAPWHIMHERFANYFTAEYTNLGTDGTVYAFIDRTKQPHAIVWFWNR